MTNKGRRNQARRPGVAGILAALILFAMIFTTGFGYLLFVTRGNETISQANAADQNSLLQAGQEALLAKITLSGTTLVVSVNNTGGVPLTISSIYVVDGTGKLVSGFMGQGPPPGTGTNIPASQWPISLLPGQSTVPLGDNIMLTGYTYTVGTSVRVEIVTARGNVFSSPYPNPNAVLPEGNILVVKMVASPPQTLTCTNCVTDAVTIYNYGASQVTGVSLSPSPPVAQVTGSASLTGGNCGAPAPSSTINGYSGSGNAPYITITCTFSSSTGSVGGFGSFSTSAIGTVGTTGVSSAEAMSNSIQIGGSSNVPTQGAFAASYFFLRFSACQNGPSGSVGSYTYSSPCSTTPATMPPASINSLTDGNYISGFSDYYVAYYVQVTNDFNTTLPILQYSYLFMDPGISTEAYSFLVGVNNSAFRANGVYYPNYNPGGGGVPTLTAYPSDCNVVNSKNVPTDTNCIYVNPGQTVTLTFAACGYAQSNWVWGGTQYGQQLDNNNNCVTTAPGYKNSVPEGQTFAVVLSYPYQSLHQAASQVYSQTMPFEGQTVTNLRTDSTVLTCSPNPDAVNAPSTCTVTVTDLSFGTAVTPTGTVTLTQAPLAGGTFSNGGSCTLSGSGAVATCPPFTYTPSLGQEGAIGLTANYPGDSVHSPSSGQTTLTATPRSTTTSVVCNPSITTPNTPTSCTVTVTDASGGTTSTPQGTVAFTQNPPSSGTFNPSAPCTLSQSSPGVATCSQPVVFTPNSNLLGTVTVTGSFTPSGDPDHASSSGSAPVKWGRTTSTVITCTSPVVVGSPSSCTVTVTDTYSGSPTTPTGTVTLTQGSPTTGSFSNGGSCTLLPSGSCSPFTFTPGLGQVSPPSLTIGASYGGDTNHQGSSGSTTITVNKAATVTTVTCSGSSCVATTTGQSPTGTITMSKFSGVGSVSFPSGTTCALSSGTCSVTVTGLTAGTVTIQAAYGGDGNNLASSGTAAQFTVYATAASISCTLSSFNVGASTTCTITLSGFGGSVTGETVTWSQTGGTGSISFPSGNTCNLSVATCTVTVMGTTSGSVTLQASYPGDYENMPSSKTTPLTVSAAKHVGLVQDVAGAAHTTSPFTCSFPSQPAVNDLVVVSFVITPSTVTVSSVNDAHGHGLSLVTSSVESSSTVTLRAYMYAELITSTGSSPITVTLSGSLTDVVATCSEWSGVLSATPVLTGSNIGTSNSNTMSIALSSSVTPTTNDLVYAFTGYSNCGSTSTPTVSAPFSAGSASISSGSPKPGSVTCTSGTTDYRLNGGDQYATSWGGGGTTAPFTVSQTAPSTGSSGWVELVVDFDPPTQAGPSASMQGTSLPHLAIGGASHADPRSILPLGLGLYSLSGFSGIVGLIFLAFGCQTLPNPLRLGIHEPRGVHDRS